MFHIRDACIGGSVCVCVCIYVCVVCVAVPLRMRVDVVCVRIYVCAHALTCFPTFSQTLVMYHTHCALMCAISVAALVNIQESPAQVKSYVIFYVINMSTCTSVHAHMHKKPIAYQRIIIVFMGKTCISLYLSMCG